MSTRAQLPFECRYGQRGVFYRWIAEQGMSIPGIMIEIAKIEGRFEPDDDPRDINPHAKPRNPAKQAPRHVGDLSFSATGADLPSRPRRYRLNLPDDHTDDTEAIRDLLDDDTDDCPEGDEYLHYLSRTQPGNRQALQVVGKQHNNGH